MAEWTITHVKDTADPGIGRAYKLVATLTNTDPTSDPINLGGNPVDWTAQINGTFDSATVKGQGSNDGSNWLDATEDDGTTAMSYTSAPADLVIPEKFGAAHRFTSSGGSGNQAVVVTVVIRHAD